MKTIDFQTQGVCSRCIHLTVNDDNTIAQVSFDGGCHGNLQGISSLVKGMTAEEVIARLEGIRCGNKMTSCPDQLCKAVREVCQLG